VTFTRYCDGDGTKEEEEGKEKELDILVNVKMSLLNKADRWGRSPLILKLSTTGS
jgi:hypothetical protein